VIRWPVILLCLAGAAFYTYYAWVRSDRDAPLDSTALFCSSLIAFAIAVALALVLVMPWALLNGFSLEQILTTDVPYRVAYRRMVGMIWCAYAFASAGSLWMVHAIFARLLRQMTSYSRFERSRVSSSFSPGGSR
jgi:hypothetical protein